MGKVTGAVAAGREAVRHADQSEDAFEMLDNRTVLADALVQAGQLDEAQALFADAETRQAEGSPLCPGYIPLQAYRYCDLLLARGCAAEVRDRAAWTSKAYDAANHQNLLDQGLNQLADARALALLAAHGDVHAQRVVGPRLDAAIAALRQAGQDTYIVAGLLARAAYHRQALERSGDASHLKQAEYDLRETQDIATRGEMRLFLTDWNLESARLCLAQIPGAPPAALVPLVEIVEIEDPAPPPPPTPKPGILDRILGRTPSAPEPAPPSIRKEERIVSQPETKMTRVQPLSDQERELLTAAQTHFNAAYDLVQDTGYHRRDPELAHLRKRLDALAALD